jgi:hypothetical protein
VTPGAVILLLMLVFAVAAVAFLISAIIATLRAIVSGLWRALTGTEPNGRTATTLSSGHFCRNPLCGEGNPEGSIFCRRCGIRLTTTVRKADLYG